MEKSILEKLKIEKFGHKLILQMPKDVEEFSSVSFDSEINRDKYDFILSFAFSTKECVAFIDDVLEKDLVSDSGYVFIAYPKKGNKKYAEYIDRDRFIEEIHMDEDGYFRKSKLKFVKMVSFNQDFTLVGLRIVEKKDRKLNIPSPCVDDYIDKIPDIIKHIENNSELLGIYNSLTYGYKKDWARYIYSARTGATIEKRYCEMEDILKKGFKTKNLYLQSLK